MNRMFVLLISLALTSCSSSPVPQTGLAGSESLLPIAAGAEALGGALTVTAVTRDADGGGFELVLRASSNAVDAFVRPRWFGDATLKREYRGANDTWIRVNLDAGVETRLRVRAPYPFATTLGLDVSRKKPAEIAGEGKALPGRLVVTPEQEKALVLFRYKDLRVTQYESAKPGAPKLAVWRDAEGKVVAAIEIHSPAPLRGYGGTGFHFLHTNGEKTIGTSLVYAGTKKGAPSKGAWDFVIFNEGEREVAVPWRPLVKNASFLGACAIGNAGLDVSQLGASARIGSIAADGTESLESAALEAPCWSMANPARGTRESGAPVTCEYSVTRPQLWEIFITDDMTFTPASGAGGGKYGRGIHAPGSGTINLGTLRAVRSERHTFTYARSTLNQDPASSERFLTTDGPVCPGDAASETAGVLSDAGSPCTSDAPGCTERPVGEMTELLVPCSSAGGTTCHTISQKGQPPGFLWVAADGDEKDPDSEFSAVPIDEEDVPQSWFEIGNTPAAKEPRKVKITVAHTPGLGDLDNTDDATFEELVKIGKQFGFDFEIVREPGKSLVKPKNGSSVATNTDSTGRTDQYLFGDLVRENFPKTKAKDPFDIVLIFTEYVRADGDFRIGFDFGSGIAIAAGAEDRTWNKGPITPGNQQSGYYRKESARGRAILLFHELLHHICGGLDVHEDKGIMAKYGPDTPLTVGPTYAEQIEKAGGKSALELKAAGLVDGGGEAK